MAKYRGKHNGQTRGPYVRRAFLYTHNRREIVETLERKLHIYLCSKGVSVSCVSKKEDIYERNSFAYHMAGATIAIKAMYYESAQNNWLHNALPRYFVHLNLTTNNSLDDVVQKILNEFSDFKEIDPRLM